jgi:TRAP-type C4-dicarboxylate transport system substrate-binding protein
VTISKPGALIVALSAVALVACTPTTQQPTSSTTRSTDPMVLRLGTGDPRGLPDTPVAEAFAEAVEERSGGSMRIEIVWQAAGDSSDPDGFERGVVGLVRDGELDLGMIGARAWDTLGVTRFQALQAPFLITDQEVLRDVLGSPLADEMLAGLEGSGVVGLALYPDGLRYPMGYEAAMTSPEDYEGARIRLVPSLATERLIRALGSEPVNDLAGDALDAAIRKGQVQGTEISLEVAASIAPKGSVLTGNVVLFPRVNSLFAGEDLWASLTDEQQQILEAAAEQAQAVAASEATEDAGPFCGSGGEIATASSDELAAWERAVQPVYQELEADPQTASLIESIRALVAVSPSGSAALTCDGT